jgi:hypothetical protein
MHCLVQPKVDEIQFNELPCSADWRKYSHPRNPLGTKRPSAGTARIGIAHSRDPHRPPVSNTEAPNGDSGESHRRSHHVVESNLNCIFWQ